MTPPTSERVSADVSWRGLVRACVIVGALLTLAAPLLYELRGVVSVALGACLAVANLWVLSLLVRRLLGPGGATLPWTLVALVKLGGLFGAMFLLVSQGLCELWPLTLGYAALPLGIFFAQLRPSPRLTPPPTAPRLTRGAR